MCDHRSPPGSLQSWTMRTLGLGRKPILAILKSLEMIMAKSKLQCIATGLFKEIISMLALGCKPKELLLYRAM